MERQRRRQHLAAAAAAAAAINQSISSIHSLFHRHVTIREMKNDNGGANGDGDDNDDGKIKKQAVQFISKERERAEPRKFRHLFFIFHVVQQQN